MSDQFSTGQRLGAEFLGSAILVFVLVSSALLGREVLDASVGLTVLFIAVATAGWLFIIVETFGDISGAHVNPAVTLGLLVTGDVDTSTTVRYVPTQFVGGLVGVLLANATYASFGVPVVAISTVSRPPSTYLAEFLGTWLLVSVVISAIRRDSAFVGLAVGLVVGGGIVGTSSTMFVNPQVSLARIFTIAISGVRPFDAVAYIVASSLGGLAAGITWNFLWPKEQVASGELSD
ncbi:aquaporin [Haloarculaceae archaeon H-GB11]|nr:aquaporin [Haloarculaceae archaeon H-GB11]